MSNSYDVIPFRDRYFTALPSSDCDFRSVSALLRQVADWIDANDIQDPEIDSLWIGVTFTSEDDQHYHHATLYYRHEGDKMR
jgi:hypothetical protein